MSGRVYLVGAGPGDPELLTLKALRLICAADVVLHDDLVSPAILALACPIALIENVGKRCGQKHVHQAEINKCMIGYAQQGFTVVRLKGGDPLIFGRAAEEIQALRTAGIEFEIVPGITAATGAAAAAKIPLTDRAGNASLLFVTAHRCSQDRAADWKALLGSRSTLAIYMPGKDYAALANEVIAAGLDAATRCVVVSQASLATQEYVLTTIRGLAEAAPLPSPAIILIEPAIAESTESSFKVGPSLAAMAWNSLTNAGPG